MRRTNSDRFPLSLWEVWFCSTIGVPIPTLIGPSQECVSNKFQHDFFGDHLQTCKVKSTASQVHDWVVYHSVGIFGSVGHRVKIHKITPATGKERGDLEIKNYVVLQKPLQQADRLPPPRTLTHTKRHRHSYIGFILAFASSIHNNKQKQKRKLLPFSLMAGKEVQGGAPKEVAACPYTYKVQSFPPLPASWCARVSKRSTRGSRIAVGVCEPSMMRTAQGH
jgi:hypothetical protein